MSAPLTTFPPIADNSETLAKRAAHERWEHLRMLEQKGFLKRSLVKQKEKDKEHGKAEGGGGDHGDQDDGGDAGDMGGGE